MGNLMSFKEWNIQISKIAKSSDRIRARLWNLAAEMRIKPQISLFRRRLGRLHSGALKTGLPRDDACLRVLQTACEDLSQPDSKWLGLLCVPPKKRLPAIMYTHIPALDFARKYASAPINLQNPPRRARFIRPYKTDADGPVCRFIWFTFPTPPARLPEDPTALVCELGLAHYAPGDYIYRIRYEVSGHKLWIPTCLDAGLYEAWAPPPLGHACPWGLTRHLITGSRCFPEVLGQVVDYSDPPYAELVSPPGRPLRIAPFTPNFLADRIGI
jgi:hypothetical protein